MENWSPDVVFYGMVVWWGRFFHETGQDMLITKELFSGLLFDEERWFIIEERDDEKEFKTENWLFPLLTGINSTRVMKWREN